MSQVRSSTAGSGRSAVTGCRRVTASWGRPSSRSRSARWVSAARSILDDPQGPGGLQGAFQVGPGLVPGAVPDQDRGQQPDRTHGHGRGTGGEALEGPANQVAAAVPVSAHVADPASIAVCIAMTS